MYRTWAEAQLGRLVSIAVTDSFMCDKAPYLPALATSDHRLPKRAPESAEERQRGKAEGRSEFP